MVIYLHPEARSPEGEDTFWDWFARTFAASFDIPERLKDNDWVLEYGPIPKPTYEGGRRIALLWEMYPQIAELGLAAAGDDIKIENMQEKYERCELSLIPSKSYRKYWPKARVFPIGVDTYRFRPGEQTKDVFWCGTDHPMKGKTKALEWAIENNREITMVEKGSMRQEDLAKLMRQHKYVLLSGMLSPLFMVEWEALSSGLFPIDISGVERTVDLSGDPRETVFNCGWSRSQTEHDWEEILFA